MEHCLKTLNWGSICFLLWGEEADYNQPQIRCEEIIVFQWIPDFGCGVSSCCSCKYLLQAVTECRKDQFVTSQFYPRFHAYFKGKCSHSAWTQPKKQTRSDFRILSLPVFAGEEPAKKPRYQETPHENPSLVVWKPVIWRKGKNVSCLICISDRFWFLPQVATCWWNLRKDAFQRTASVSLTRFPLLLRRKANERFSWFCVCGFFDVKETQHTPVDKRFCDKVK